MVLSTTIARLSDGLPLAASVEDQSEEEKLAEYKKQAKLVIRQLNDQSETRASIESGAYLLHYLIDQGVVYLVIANKSYPRALAFSYLSDLASEFTTSYPPSQTADPRLRPYAFVAFDTFMQKTKRIYADPRAVQEHAYGGGGTKTKGGLDQLESELKDVQRVMTKNIEDLLYRGDSLNRMSDLSSSLRDESKKYRKKARDINLEAMLRQYGPIGAIVLFVLFIFWWRFF
ncbi:SNAP receptor [Saitoella coloradoensis]